MNTKWLEAQTKAPTCSRALCGHWSNGRGGLHDRYLEAGPDRVLVVHHDPIIACHEMHLAGARHLGLVVVIVVVRVLVVVVVVGCIGDERLEATAARRSLNRWLTYKAYLRLV